MTNGQAPQFDSVRRRIADYSDQVESWKQDHELAMYCTEFELFLQHGLSLLSQLHNVDEKVRLMIYRGAAEHDPQFDQTLREQFELWLKPCDKLLAELESLERERFNVEHAETFRAACREVRGILTDDSKFFAEDGFASLRDEAIDEHRAGLCEPL